MESNQLIKLWLKSRKLYFIETKIRSVIVKNIIKFSSIDRKGLFTNTINMKRGERSGGVSEKRQNFDNHT